jgi:hypothetical protein
MRRNLIEFRNAIAPADRSGLDWADPGRDRKVGNESSFGIARSMDDKTAVNGFVKQYVRDHLLLRTEPASNNVHDYRCNKAIENLPRLRDNMSSVIDNYHNVQQAILETFVDRGQLRKLAQPTILPNGRRVPGLKLDHPRQLAVMHALVRFCYIAAQNTFTTTEIYTDTLAALETSSNEYSLGALRYDLWKLRAKGLLEKLPHSRRYRIPREGYSICLGVSQTLREDLRSPYRRTPAALFRRRKVVTAKAHAARQAVPARH